MATIFKGIIAFCHLRDIIIEKFSTTKGVGCMNPKELKHLNRRELIEIIYQMKKNEQEQQEKIAALEEELQDKRIRISTAGSIADAAVGITQILTTAQNTADLYLQEITSMKEDIEKERTRILANARKQAKLILAQARQQRSETTAEQSEQTIAIPSLKEILAYGPESVTTVPESDWV